MSVALLAEWIGAVEKLITAAGSLATFVILIHQFAISRRQDKFAQGQDALLQKQTTLAHEMNGMRAALVSSEKKLSHAEGVVAGAQQQGAVDQARAEGLASNAMNRQMVKE